MTSERKSAGLVMLPPLDDAEGPARRLPVHRTDRMIQAALDAHFGRAPRTRVPLARFALAAGLALALGGVAGAGVLVRQHLVGKDEARRARRAQPSRAHRTPVAAPRPAPPAEPGLDREPVAPEEAPHPAPRLTPKKPARATVTPESLLQRASDLRAARQWRQAERAYARVIEAAPGSDSALASAVAAGFLRLEHLADPLGARRSFQSVLAARPRGALAEEARWGLAETYRALDDPAGERRALAEFLTFHPQSFKRRRAEARHEELRRDTP